MPHGAASPALAGRLRPSGPRASRTLRAATPAAPAVQPVQETDLARGGHDLPRNRAAADRPVRGHPPDRHGEERCPVGRAGPPSRRQAAHGLDHDARDRGGDGAPRRRGAAPGSGGDRRRLFRRPTLRQAWTHRGGRDAVRGGGLARRRGASAQSEAGPGRGLPRARDRARRATLAGPPIRVATDGFGCRNALGEGAFGHRAVLTGSGPKAVRMPSFNRVGTTLGGIESAIAGTCRKIGPSHADRCLAGFARRCNRRYRLKTMIPQPVHSAARTDPIPCRVLAAG